MRWAWVAGLLTACGAPAPEAESGGATQQVSARPPDSLASRPVPGVEIWFMVGRPASDSAGQACYERSLEIRDSIGRRVVPLLYTLEPPARLDDTSVVARVYRNCQPGDRYRVSLRTGRPTPLAP